MKHRVGRWIYSLVKEYNVESPTTDTSITENKMTLHKCQDTQANPLLCEPSRSQDEGTKTLLHVPLEDSIIDFLPVTHKLRQNTTALSHRGVNIYSFLNQFCGGETHKVNGILSFIGDLFIISASAINC